MTIWLLAVVLVACLAGLNYRQGAIRVGFSFLGILFGAGLAAPLSGLVRFALSLVGLKNPLILWAVCPLVVFFSVLFLFKIIGYTVHQRVEVFYKYHAGDLRLAHWERLNQRLGACLGLANIAAYLALLSMVIYSLSYWTVQFGSGDQDPKWMRLLNQMGRDLESTGFARVARAVDPKPRLYYDMADLTGVLYCNPLSEARLLLYPGFLVLSERPEIQDVANDTTFTEMWQRHDPVMAFYDAPKIQTILKSPELLNSIWQTVTPDLSDLETFMETGRSPKYSSEQLLGRWDFNVSAALIAVRRTKPNIGWSEMQRMKQWMLATFSKTSLVAMTDHKVILRNVPPLGQTAASGASFQTLQGQWSSVNGKYQLSVTSGANNQDLTAVVDGDRLTVKNPGIDLVFERRN